MWTLIQEYHDSFIYHVDVLNCHGQKCGDSFAVTCKELALNDNFEPDCFDTLELIDNLSKLNYQGEGVFSTREQAKDFIDEFNATIREQNKKKKKYIYFVRYDDGDEETKVVELDYQVDERTYGRFLQKYNLDDFEVLNLSFLGIKEN